MGLSKTVDSLLVRMTEVGGVDKGVYGEEAVFKICETIYQSVGGILMHSYSYKADKELAGNIKRLADGSFFLENVGTTTEIDVLLVTPYRIFPIEVKAYKSNSIQLTDEAIEGCFKTDKSPVHQNEMHCRHLYPHIVQALPHGSSEFIKPIVVFVDKCTVTDSRSDWQKEYITVTILNRLKDTIYSLNTPVDGKYKLDLYMLDRLLTEAQADVSKKLPVRERR